MEPPAPPAGRIALLYHGRLVEDQKNVSQIIRLGAVLRARGVPFRITMVGQGEAEPRCRELVGELGLGDHVVFHESRAPSLLARFFSEHHLSILTSGHEGFCISLAEAMSVGLPGVAFECEGVIEEYLHDGYNGFVVPFGDLDSMADRVAFFCTRPDEWARFSRRARAEIRWRYAPETILSRYNSFFSRLASGPSCGRWPKLRPVYSTTGCHPWHAVIEKMGTRLAGWPSPQSIEGCLAEFGVRH